MKTTFKNIFLFFTILFSLTSFVYAQTFERNAKESSEDFVRRIFPTDASMQFKPVENKFGTTVKKIIYFSKKLAMNASIDSTKAIDCIYANILIPENETSNKYTLQTLLMDCNRDYAVQIDDAFGAKDKQKNPVLSILYCQVKRVSTRLLIKY